MACAASQTLNGAGASFPSSIYQRWFKDLAGQGLMVNYQSVGSGAGIRQLLAGSTDFGASDVPMSADEIKQMKAGVVQLPMTAGAIVVAFNNPGCQLKLSQAQLADIFLGTINNYSQLGCTAKPIVVVHRSDGSGTTANFTAHLSAISAGWKKGPGAGKSVAWPIGVGARGNEGVAAQLNQLAGGIGYMEVAYAKPPLQTAALTNAAGEVVTPTAASEQQALAAIELGPELTGSNANPAKGYPIVSYTWILLKKQGYGPKLAAIKKVFSYTLSAQAQALAPGLGFIALPQEVVTRAQAELAQLKP